MFQKLPSHSCKWVEQYKLLLPLSRQLTPPCKATGMKHREFALSALVQSWPNPLMKVAQANLADDSRFCPVETHL